MKRKMLLLTLAIPVILCQNAQAQSSRLIAQSDWSNTGALLTPVDSTWYTYLSGSRGGDLNSQLKYDNATNWYYSGDTAYINNLYYIQTFDGNNNVLSTITQYWSGSAWINWTNVLYTYNSSNQLLTMTNQSWGGGSWTNISQDVYSYNTAGQLFSDKYTVWNNLTNTFDQSTQSIYTYDGSGNLIQELDQSYNSVSMIYNYTTQILYTYSATNQLLTTTNSTWNSSTFVNNYMYTNTYDSASGDLLTNLYQTWSGTAWVNQVLKVYSNFVSGTTIPQTQINQNWDNTGSGSWDNITMYMYTYNSNYQMTSAIGESWNAGVGWEFASGDPASFYYYGGFTASVKNVVNTGGDVNIYPVPASNLLHIDLTWTEAQSSTIAIYDMNGRQVNKIDAPMGAQYHGAVSVSNLADGMYVIRINGTQGQIVKQIVVAH